MALVKKPSANGEKNAIYLPIELVSVKIKKRKELQTTGKIRKNAEFQKNDN